MAEPEQAGLPEAWVRDVTRDAIRHFAWGIGDNNPLWLDPEYAAQSPHHGLLAPPCFAYALHETTVAAGFEQRQRIYQRVDWQWFDVIRLGTRLTVSAVLQDTDTGPDEAVQIGAVEYRGASDEIVASAHARCCRPRQPRPLAPAHPEAKYSDPELARIEQAILAEARRGAEPRYWADTPVGTELGPLTKGPLSIMDIVAWCAGALGVPDDYSGASAGGLTDELATGPQLTAWCSQLLTDWAGDAGFLHRLQVNIAQQPGLGSTTVVTGSVTHRWQVDSHHAVQVELTASGRGSQPVANATAILLLPTHDQPVRLPIAQPISFQATP